GVPCLFSYAHSFNLMSYPRTVSGIMFIYRVDDIVNLKRLADVGIRPAMLGNVVDLTNRRDHDSRQVCGLFIRPSFLAKATSPTPAQPLVHQYQTHVIIL